MKFYWFENGLKDRNGYGLSNKGVWCSGITFALHAKGPGFEPRFFQNLFNFGDLRLIRATTNTDDVQLNLTKTTIGNYYWTTTNYSAYNFLAAYWTLFLRLQPLVDAFAVVLVLARQLFVLDP